MINDLRPFENKKTNYRTNKSSKFYESIRKRKEVSSMIKSSLTRFEYINTYLYAWRLKLSKIFENLAK